MSANIGKRGKALVSRSRSGVLNIPISFTLLYLCRNLFIAFSSVYLECIANELCRHYYLFEENLNTNYFVANSFDLEHKGSKFISQDQIQSLENMLLTIFQISYSVHTYNVVLY